MISRNVADRALRSGNLGNPRADHSNRSESEIAEIAGRYHHPVALGCGGDQRVDGWHPHGTCRTARHDYAPDPGDPAIDIEDSVLEPIRQIDLQRRNR
jgi:hypothetical protein